MLSIRFGTTPRLVSTALVALACAAATVAPAASAWVGAPGSGAPMSASNCTWTGYWVWDKKAKKWHWVWTCKPQYSASVS